MVDTIVALNDVRLSFPHLAKPGQSTPDAALKYSADFVMGPNHPGYIRFMQVCKQMALEEWKDNADKIIAIINGDRKLRCFGMGEEKINKKTLETYDGYAGMVFVSASTIADKPPQMIRPDGTSAEPFTEEWMILARQLVGGYRVNAVVRPWLQDNKHGRGIRCNLSGIQFLAKDEAFGRGDEDVSALFAAIPDTAPTAAPAMPDFLG